MIVSAAVKFKMSDGREITMPVHRHGDAYQILHDLGFKFNDFTTVSQGFLYSMPDPDDKFNYIYGYLNRVEAFKHARECGQINASLPDTELYSEDLW
jgi:hypothetical protein